MEIVLGVVLGIAPQESWGPIRFIPFAVGMYRFEKFERLHRLENLTTGQVDVTKGLTFEGDDPTDAGATVVFEVARTDKLRIFADVPEAIENTLEIARRFAFFPKKRSPILPPFKPAFADGFSCRVVLLRPESRGTVRLASADPAALAVAQAA